jgi:CRISPR system Cascade subunit CasC
MSTTTATPLYVDIHVLQTVPPSNLNRDDAGSPKQATYGGARRARVSSQAWKRATRTEFVSLLPAEKLATRTKKISALLADRIVDRCGLDRENATRLSTSMLAPLEITAGKKAAETAYLLFFGRAQLDQLVDLVVERAGELVALDDAALTAAVKDLPVRGKLAAGHPVDVALFGRMVADIPGLNVDAATQVAHALSTHAVDVEFDYFTAVDDENPKEDTGAGMIGTVEFNSATLYRFATVGVHQLLDNLGGDLDAGLEALTAFLIAFVRSMPTGHQNSFGHRTAPNVVSIAVRQDQPVNLVSAFESPVRATTESNEGTGMVAESTRRLADELQRTSALWGLTPALVLSTYHPGQDGARLSALGDPVPFNDAVAGVADAVRKHLSGQDA